MNKDLSSLTCPYCGQKVTYEIVGEDIIGDLKTIKESTIFKCDCGLKLVKTEFTTGEYQVLEIKGCD